MTDDLGGAALALWPLPSEAEVRPGDDLATLLLDAVDRAGVELADGDVVAVASKVVAKAEGRLVPLPPAADVHAARRALARAEAVRVVADDVAVLVVETTHGLVCANAGIDTSNVPADDLALLLPEDPDASAARLRAAVADRTGASVGVVVTDTFGRPWRLGQTDVAIGAAGVRVLRDDRGGVDRHGRALHVTAAAVGDALAAAADLVRRKHDGVPFVLLRGPDVAGDGAAADLVRPSAEDLFRTGGPTAALAALRDGAGAALDVPPVEPARPTPRLVEAVTSAVAAATAGRCSVVLAERALRVEGDGAALGAAGLAALVVVAAHGFDAFVDLDVEGGSAVVLVAERS